MDWEKFINDMRAQLNDALSKLPPIEQVEAASEAGWALRNLCEMAKRMEERMTGLKGAVEEALSKCKQTSEAGAVTAALERGEVLLASVLEKYIAKDTHEATIESVRNDVRAAVEAEMQAKAQRDQLLSERVAQAAEKLGVKADLLSSAAEALLAEDHEAQVGKLEARVNRLKSLGVTSEKLVGAALSLPVTDEGETQWTAKVGEIEAAITDARAASGKPLNPLANAGNGNGNGSRMVLA